jgi:predicted PurR-regulated permease PerM
VTTAGTLLFGVLGATLAAPVTAVTLRTIGLLRDAGLFEMAATPPSAAGELPPSQERHEASTGPTLAE